MHCFATAVLAALAAAVLAAAAPAQRLIACESNRTLWEVDRTTASRTQIGTISSNAGISAGLAFDPASGTLYLTSTGNDSVYRLDLATGNATLIGAYGNPSLVMHGLEWDSSTGTLYGASQHDNGLYRIDTATGAATLIGTSGLTSFVNLGYDAANDVLYATNSGTDSLYVVDRSTGAQTLVGPLGGPTNPNGLAHEPGADVLWLVDNSTDTLYRVDRSTGAATAVGSTGPGNLLGLVWLPDGGSIVRTPHGCGPTTIATTGVPRPGGTVTTVLGGVTGAPFTGLGLLPLNVPFCTCTLGHEWAAPNFGATLQIQVPNSAAFAGVTVLIQGADLFGTGGCAAPVLTLTDTMVVTIG